MDRPGSNGGANPSQTPLIGGGGSGASDKWDEEGLKRFYRAFVKHQQSWSKVSRAMGGSKTSEQCEAMWKQNKTFLSLPSPSLELMEVAFVGLMNDHYNRDAPAPSDGPQQPAAGEPSTRQPQQQQQQQQQVEGSLAAHSSRPGAAPPQPLPQQHPEATYVHSARTANHPPAVAVAGAEPDGGGGEESDEGWAPGHEEAPRTRRAAKRGLHEAGDGKQGANDGSMPPPATAGAAGGGAPGSAPLRESKRQATGTPYTRSMFGSPDTPKSKIKVSTGVTALLTHHHTHVCTPVLGQASAVPSSLSKLKLSPLPQSDSSSRKRRSSRKLFEEEAEDSEKVFEQWRGGLSGRTHGPCTRVMRSLVWLQQRRGGLEERFSDLGERQHLEEIDEGVDALLSLGSMANHPNMDGDGGGEAGAAAERGGGGGRGGDEMHDLMLLDERSIPSSARSRRAGAGKHSRNNCSFDFGSPLRSPPSSARAHANIHPHHRLHHPLTGNSNNSVLPAEHPHHSTHPRSNADHHHHHQSSQHSQPHSSSNHQQQQQQHHSGSERHSPPRSATAAAAAAHASKPVSPSGFRSPTPLLRGTIRLGNRSSLAADLDDLAAVVSPGIPNVPFYASELPPGSSNGAGGHGGGASEGGGNGGGGLRGLASPLVSPAGSRPGTGLRGKRRSGMPAPPVVDALVEDGDEEDLLHQHPNSALPNLMSPMNGGLSNNRQRASVFAPHAGSSAAFDHERQRSSLDGRQNTLILAVTHPSPPTVVGLFHGQGSDGSLASRNTNPLGSHGSHGSPKAAAAGRQYHHQRQQEQQQRMGNNDHQHHHPSQSQPHSHSHNQNGGNKSYHTGGSHHHNSGSVEQDVEGDTEDDFEVEESRGGCAEGEWAKRAAASPAAAAAAASPAAAAAAARGTRGTRGDSGKGEAPQDGP
ncbi:MAG: hypothetical protein WDW38_005260 [Sanguina aurantia]